MKLFLTVISYIEFKAYIKKKELKCLCYDMIRCILVVYNQPVDES